MDTAEIPFPSFIFPGSLLLAGPTTSGKSVILSSILKNREYMFTQKIDHIIYCHAEDPEEQFTNIRGLELHLGLPDEDTLSRWFVIYKGKNVILAFDDLAQAFYSSAISESLLGRHAHHKSLFIIVASQNVYPKARFARQASLQFHGIILTRTCRDSLQIQHLGSAIFGSGGGRKFLAAFLDATQLRVDKHPSYVYIQLHPIFTNRQLRVFTNIFPFEQPMIGYKI